MGAKAPLFLEENMASKKGKVKREMAEREVALIYRYLDGIYKKIKICGSFRRNVSEVGDIDVVIVPADGGNLSSLICAIKNMSKEVLSSGDKIVRIVTVNDIQCDFYITSETFFESHVLFLTGSKWFNIKCRSLAKNLGLRLSQYGLIDEMGEIVALGEEEILNKIGMGHFLSPETRSVQ